MHFHSAALVSVEQWKKIAVFVILILFPFSSSSFTSRWNSVFLLLLIKYFRASKALNSWFRLKWFGISHFYSPIKDLKRILHSNETKERKKCKKKLLQISFIKLKQNVVFFFWQNSSSYDSWALGHWTSFMPKLKNTRNKMFALLHERNVLISVNFFFRSFLH